MKNYLLATALIACISVQAQNQKPTAKDTLNTQNIDEVFINKYIKKDTEYSNKMPLKAIENSQVYSSIDKIFFENQQLFTLDEGFRNITGLQKMWNPTHRAGDGGSFFNLRGFIVNKPLRNGFVAPNSTSLDAVNMEKFEVLKGPSATLYGSSFGSYGGIMNIVTKVPMDSLFTHVSVSGGSYNFWRAQADFNAPLTKNNQLLFRLNTAYTIEGTFQKTYAKNRYLALAPSLLFHANDKLSLALDYEGFLTKALPEQLFFYLSPALGFDNLRALYSNTGLDYKQSYIGSGLHTDAFVHNLFAKATYQINPNIRSSSHIGYSYSGSNGSNPYFSLGTKGSLSGNANETELGIIRADQSTEDAWQKNIQIQQNFNFDYQFGTMRNRTVAGFDFNKSDDNSRFIFGQIDWVAFNQSNYSDFNAKRINDYYQALKNRPNYNFDQNNRWNSITQKNTYSGYISNVFSPISAIHLMTAIRYENIDFKGGRIGPNEAKAYNQSAWSPKVGLVVELLKDKLSLFGNYQNSFKSNGYFIGDASGNLKLSDPETANQLEGGFKAVLFNDRLSANVNYYSIDVKNTILNSGETVPNTSIAIQNQTGQLRSQGMELEINAYLVKGFSLIGGLSYNDSKFIKSDAAVEGRRPNIAISPWLVNFYASYLFYSGQAKGLGIGIGGNYASDNKIVNSINPMTQVESIFTLNSYFVLNANVFYETKKYKIGFKIDNLTNEKYWIGYTTANPQKLSNAVGSITYKF